MTDTERLRAYDDLLTAVMPEDFKDWHENSRDEWPEVAALVIVGLRAKANAPADPALLALAKLGAWLCAHHWLDIDGGADGFGPAKSGLIMNAAMRYGVMHPDNSPRSGITWTVESLLAPDGAASEGVTDA